MLSLLMGVQALGAQSVRHAQDIKGLQGALSACYSAKKDRYYYFEPDYNKPNFIYCYDGTYGRRIKSIPLEFHAGKPKISKDERYIYFVSPFDRKVHRLDLENDQVETVLNLPDSTAAIRDHGILPGNSNQYIVSWSKLDGSMGIGLFEGISNFAQGTKANFGCHGLIMHNDSTYYGIGGTDFLITIKHRLNQIVLADTTQQITYYDVGVGATLNGDTLYGASGKVYDVSTFKPRLIRKPEDTGLYYYSMASVDGSDYWYHLQNISNRIELLRISKREGRVVSTWEVPNPRPGYFSFFQFNLLAKDRFLFSTDPENYIVWLCQAQTPAPKVEQGQEIKVCESEQSNLILKAADAVPEYLWSNGASTSSLDLKASITLSLQYGDARGCLTPTTPPIQVTFVPAENQPWINNQMAPFTVDVCKNSSVKLSAAEPYATNFQWSTGATTGEIEVNKAGEYRVRTIGFSGCPSKWSYTAKVNILPDSIPAKPVIQSTKGSFQYCSGEVAQLFLPPGYNYYLWQGQKTSSPTWKLYNSTQLNVRVGTDARCLSEWSDWVNVVFNPTPKQPAIQRIENLLATNNTGEYHEWYWNNQLISGENSQFLTITKNGEYIVKTTVKGCVSPYASSIVVQNLLPTAVRNIALVELKLFPNPVTNTLFLPTAQQLFWGPGFTHQIINLDGKISYRGPLKNELDVRELPAGIYLLRIMDGPKIHAQTRFVKL
jgi:hypothetical protein